MSTTQRSYRRIDLCFILNLRNKATKTTMPVAELGEMVREVVTDEQRLLHTYLNLSESILSGYEEEGWFEKTYETVRKHAEAYTRNTPGPLVSYTPEHGNASSKIKIARLLWFYELKGRKIPISRIQLAQEQKLVIEQIKGVTVVNSGPGTGKTTTAAHKAARLMKEGVLIVCYTRAAVDNFLAKLLEIVDDVNEISQKPGKKIWLATIDSVSQATTSKNQRKGANVNFDAQVEAAIRDQVQFASVFLGLNNEPLYLHMIVDECQDVSDERDRLLRAIYTIWNFQSLTMIGDPRQRLNVQYGGSFQEMLIKGTKITQDTVNAPVGSLEKPNVIEYHMSYRFVNEALLKLCNVLSSTRPEIHSELVYAGGGTNPMGGTDKGMMDGSGRVASLVKFASFEAIAADVLAKISTGSKPSSICIISPVTQKASATKTKFDAIRQILASNGIMTSEQFGGETVYTSSIQSVKGLEFDHVYFIGASGYPTYMNQEYKDINDGQSMNFVVNTRARLSITYLTDSSNRAPDLVPDEMTTGGVARQVNYHREVYPESIKTDDIDASDYEKFTGSNLLRIPFEQIARFSTESNPGNYTYEIVSAILGLMRGHNTPMQLGDQVIPMEDSKYADYFRRGMLFDMRGKDGTIYISQAQLSMMGSLRATYDETDIDVHRLLKKCMTNRNSNLTSMVQINDVIMKVVNLLRSAPSATPPRQDIVGERIRATSITTESMVVIFSECMYLGGLVKKRNPFKQVYLVQLQTGSISKIGDVIRPLKQYEYMINSLFSITVHYRLIRGRARFSLASVDQNRPWYFVDTEFTPRAWLKSETIYDIALINGFDPYASITTYLRCDPNCFNSFLNPDVKLQDLEGAPTVDEFYTFFCHLNSGKKPVLWYFSASHDISPFYEQHDFYDEARDTVPKSLGDWQYKKELDYEFEFRNARIGNSKGTQSEMYEGLLKTKISSYRHILLHTAVSDGLILAEYVMTRELGRHEMGQAQ